MPQLPRLLVVSHDYSLTGAPIALLNLVAGLTGHFDVLVASPFEGPLRKHFLQHPLHAVVAPHLHDNIDVSAGLLLSCDAVLANTLLSYLPIHAASQLQKPSAWYLHEGHVASRFCRDYPGIVPALPLATCVAVPCQFSRNLYRNLRPFSELIPYGIARRETAVPPRQATGPLKLLQLGSIEPRKGQDTACAAVQLLQGQAVELHIVGNPLDTDFSNRLRGSCANSPQIQFHGQVDPAQTPALIEQCDALVVPSRDEVTPLVILEAMAAGKPVIASAVGGVPEMITQNETGFLFPCQDAPSLASILARLASEPETRRAIGAAAQTFVRAHRTLEQYRDSFVKLLHALLTRPKHA